MPFDATAQHNNFHMMDQTHFPSFSQHLRLIREASTPSYEAPCEAKFRMKMEESFARLWKIKADWHFTGNRA